MTSAEQDGQPPAWLRDLASSADRLVVPSAMRPPPDGGRHSAGLILLGDGSAGPHLLLLQPRPTPRRHAAQPAQLAPAIRATIGAAHLLAVMLAAVFLVLTAWVKGNTSLYLFNTVLAAFVIGILL